MSEIHVNNIRFEHHQNGLGVSQASPRLSWRFAHSGDTPSDWVQSSYDIEIGRPSTEKTKVFHSKSADNVLVPWPDQPLASGETAYVRVKTSGAIHGKQDLDSEWSSWVTVEAGLLKREDWTAKCIVSPAGAKKKHPDERGIRPVRFRKSFELPQKPDKARLYITALGLYEVYVNGSRVGDECLAPGWTAYQHRIQYQVFDVASLLKPGKTNMLSVEVGEGWYAGRLAFGDGVKCFYGDRIGVLAQLHVAEHNTTPFRLTTDNTWECAQSPIVASDIYDGENYDLGLETSDWHHQGTWDRVETIDLPKASLVSASCAPVRVTESLKPTKIFTDPDGLTLVDFGQNLVGKIQIHSLTKPDGHRLRIRHAEVLENERLGVRPLREAKQADTIIFGGGRTLKNWSPHFTYHGFRYIELQGWDASEVTKDSLSALVMHTDMERTGHFECSDKDVNDLHKNVVWSMRGNFVSIPTDCPQRDERLGWTGDIQVFGPTASFLYDCAGMLGNWMRDVIFDQKDAKGIVPLIVPNILSRTWPATPQAVWDDVVILLPWTLYRHFGDLNILGETYAGMKDYLDTIKRGPDGLWDPSLWQLGDWLDPNAPPDQPGLARTDGVIVADAYIVHVTEIISQIATLLGFTEDAKRFATDGKRLKQLFGDKYITKLGLVVADTQTALALAILFKLHDEPEQRKAAADRLARLVRTSKFKVSTGFAGTPIILHALSETGNTQLAYRMLLETGCPSWLYPIRMGATTVWERWDSMLADGSINPGEMTSFNHYALGSVANWLHASIGGVSPLEPGWRKFLVRPRPGGQLTHANVDLLSPYGKLHCGWELGADGKMVLKLTVPANTTALVALPDGSEEKTVGSGLHTFTCHFNQEAEGKWPPQPLESALDETL